MATSMNATQRSLIGKGGARQTRRSGFVPGIVYGSVKEPIPVSVPAKEFSLLLSREGESVLIDLNLHDDKGKSIAQEKVVIRQVDYDPLKDLPIHVDFQAVAMDKKLTISVPIELTGDPIGVVRNKGQMSQVAFEIEIECLPGAIPHSIVVNVAAMDIGQSVHVSDLATMEGIRYLTLPEQTIVTVEAPKVEEAVAGAGEETAAAAEPEVITKRREEEE